MATATPQYSPRKFLQKYFLLRRSGHRGTPPGSKLAKCSRRVPRTRITSDVIFYRFSRPDRALEMLKQSKSVPLQIHCRDFSFRITEENEDMARLIMAQFDHMQELDIHAPAQSEISRFMDLNTSAKAPLLEHLRLESSSDPGPSSLDLPPLSHLTSLQISLSTHSSMSPSYLLSSLQHSPNLEEIVISGMTKGDLTDPPQHVKLANLSRISITSTDLEASAIFTNLEFIERGQHVPSLLDPRALAIYEVKCNGWLSEGPFRLTVSCWEPPTWGPGEKLTISLKIASHSYSAACMAICSALPLEIALILRVGGLNDMTHTQWMSIFSRCKRIQQLHFDDVSLSLFRTLVKLSKGKSLRLLPKLQEVHLVGCIVIDPVDRYVELLESSSFNVTEKFFKQQKHLKKPVKVITIEACQINMAAIAKLAQYTEVNWDGKEEEEEEEEVNYYPNIFSDNPYEFMGLYQD
ncbi:hypothetical protein BDN71DRAFT_1511423 [Pleurotus eryngii]|uniref:Uncharacterized protein n=1 Tax=Pleurotus eryngii TaxID=5323 RepID=A0A9P5ZNE8_PLEER|nr:hypothetical protein BDN71DRAFT_1511423 [Pleurotus eryngii]